MRIDEYDLLVVLVLLVVAVSFAREPSETWTVVVVGYSLYLVGKYRDPPRMR